MYLKGTFLLLTLVNLGPVKSFRPGITIRKTKVRNPNPIKGPNSRRVFLGIVSIIINPVQTPASRFRPFLPWAVRS